MKSLIIAIGAMLIAGTAAALPVLHDGYVYELETRFVSYEDQSTLLESQVWWGAPEFDVRTLALSYFVAGGAPIGVPVFFGRSFDPVRFAGVDALQIRRVGSTRLLPVYFNSELRSVSYANYAIAASRRKAAEIPLPSTLGLLMLGLAGLGVTRKAWR